MALREVRPGLPVVAACRACGARARRPLLHAAAGPGRSLCGLDWAPTLGRGWDVTCPACARAWLDARAAPAPDWRPAEALAEDFYAG